jgi:hypothetical protein
LTSLETGFTAFVAATGAAFTGLAMIRDGLGAVRAGVRVTVGLAPLAASFFPAVFIPTPFNVGACFFGVEELADDFALVGFFGVVFATGIPLSPGWRPETSKEATREGKGFETEA